MLRTIKILGSILFIASLTTIMLNQNETLAFNQNETLAQPEILVNKTIENNNTSYKDTLAPVPDRVYSISDLLQVGNNLVESESVQCDREDVLVGGGHDIITEDKKDKIVIIDDFPFENDATDTRGWTIKAWNNAAGVTVDIEVKALCYDENRSST